MKKHKVTAVYWVFADIPAMWISKSVGATASRFAFVPSLGKVVKGTVPVVVADNLAAPLIGGFVESFSSLHFCRFCIGERSQTGLPTVPQNTGLPCVPYLKLWELATLVIQEHEVGEGLFPHKSNHAMHVKAALSDLADVHFGVKQQCPISDKLSYFHATSGYPSDYLHEFLEGIVPPTMSLCLDVFINKKYFSLQELNHSIHCFPYKWSDRTNSPHVNFA